MKASIPRIVLRTALGAAGCAYASLVLLPGSALASWLSRIPLVAQAIAFPSIAAAGTVLAVAAALLGGLLARRVEGPRAGGGQRAAKGGGPRPARRGPTGFALACSALFAVPSLILAASPGFGIASARGESLSSTSSAAVSVIAWNAAGRAGPEEIRDLLDGRDPDVIVLPEYRDGGEAGARRLAGMLAASGRDPRNYSVFSSPTDPAYDPTTVAIHKRLGEYRAAGGIATTFGSLTLRPSDPAKPTIVAVHTAPPVPGLMGRWRRDLDEVRAYMDRERGRTILAGDFNATLRHGGLGSSPRWAGRTRLRGLEGRHLAEFAAGRPRLSYRPRLRQLRGVGGLGGGHRAGRIRSQRRRRARSLLRGGTAAGMRGVRRVATFCASRPGGAPMPAADRTRRLFRASFRFGRPIPRPRTAAATPTRRPHGRAPPAGPAPIYRYDPRCHRLKFRTRAVPPSAKRATLSDLPALPAAMPRG